MNNMEKPPYGRVSFFDEILKLMTQRDENDHTIVEIGMTRTIDNWEGDGYSTPLFAWFINKYGGRLISIDILPEAVTTCSNIIKSYDIPFDNIFLISGDGLSFFDNFNFEIDLLYLDAWDWHDPEEEKIDSEKKHLLCFQKAEKYLKSGGYIMIDDIFDTKTWKGKGKQLIPYLLENNYKQILTGYICAFEKP